jgi:hypothetical protein
METTSKPKVATIPLVAAIPIPYSTIPINLFHGKVDTSAKANIKSNRTQPYSVIDSQQRTGERKSCLNCNNQTHNQTVSGEQTATANIKLSNMFNGSPMLILPFVSAATKPSAIQQKAVPTNLYSQHSVSVYHAKKSEDSSRVI